MRKPKAFVRMIGFVLSCALILSATGCAVNTLNASVSSASGSETADSSTTYMSGESTNSSFTNNDATSAPSETELNRLCVVIDPGHQRKANSELEPIGPGAIEKKAKVSGGTVGQFSKLAEYELNLQVGLKLQAELERRNFRVVMTRTSHDVNLSNAERAKIAKDSNADVFVRIHANGSEDPSVQGAMTICMTKGNPYCAELYPASRLLSDYILKNMTRTTGGKQRNVWETDTMSGINWATMPVTIVEMGYMTNKEEDLLMADPGYQQRVAAGIADGIEEYFNACSLPEPAPENKELETLIAEKLTGRSDIWDVWCENLRDGSVAAVHFNAAEDYRMVAASLIKLFVMGKVFEEIEKGTIDYASVRSDLTKMIQISDNASTNRLIRLLGNGSADAGIKQVNDFAHRIGCDETQLNRLMLDNNGLENYTSGRDCAEILRLIYRGECVTSEYSREMLDILKGQEKNAKIPALLPQNTVVAHKTGTLTHLSNGDVGIVYGPENDYIVCIINNKSRNDPKTVNAIADLSLAVYNHYK